MGRPIGNFVTPRWSDFVIIVAVVCVLLWLFN